MRHVKVFCAAFLAVLTFSAISVAVANAAAEWLEDGKAMTAPAAAATVKTWKLLGTLFWGFIDIEVECRLRLTGTVGPGAKDEITSVEDAKGNKTKLECTVSSVSPGGCQAGETAIIEVTHLPWPTKLVAGTTQPKDEFTGTGGQPGFTLKCNGHSNTCEGKVLSEELKNKIAGVSETISKSKSEKCLESGSSDEINSSGETLLSNGKTLSVVN